MLSSINIIEVQLFVFCNTNINPKMTKMAKASSEMFGEDDDYNSLNKAEVAWSPSRRNHLPQTQTETERGLKKLKSMLNKMTMENVHSLKASIVREITSADILQVFVSLLYEKAMLEPTYCSMYASLCHGLKCLLPKFYTDEFGKKQTSFSRILLDICQSTFESSQNMKEETGNMTISEEHERKFRKLGNIRFISELFKCEMITSKIMLRMASVLLDSRDDFGSNTCPSEENVEAICHIYGHVGELLDGKEGYRQWNDFYFSKLEELTANPGLAPRSRLMVLDVIDLRTRNWRPRRTKVGAATPRDSTTFASGIEDFIQNRVPVHPRFSGILSPQKQLPPAISDLHFNIAYLVEEYLCVPILHMAFKRVKNLKLRDSHRDVLVTETIALALEKDPPCVDRVVELLKSLFDKNILTDHDIRIGCIYYSLALDNIGTDIPNAPHNYGKILGKLVSEEVLDYTPVTDGIKFIGRDKFQFAVISSITATIGKRQVPITLQR